MNEAQRKEPPVQLEVVMTGLAKLQERLETYLQKVDDLQQAARLLEIYGRYAAILSDLLADWHKSQQGTADDLTHIIGQALDELSQEWQVTL